MATMIDEDGLPSVDPDLINSCLRRAMGGQAIHADRLNRQPVKCVNTTTLMIVRDTNTLRPDALLPGVDSVITDERLNARVSEPTERPGMINVRVQIIVKRQAYFVDFPGFREGQINMLRHCLAGVGDPDIGPLLRTRDA